MTFCDSGGTCSCFHYWNSQSSIWSINLCHQVSDLSGGPSSPAETLPCGSIPWIEGKTSYFHRSFTQSLKLSLRVSAGLLAGYLGPSIPFSSLLKSCQKKMRKILCFFYKNESFKLCVWVYVLSLHVHGLYVIRVCLLIYMW